MNRATILYDGDCGSCRWSADLVRRWDRWDRLAFEPIRGPVGDRLLTRIPPARRLGSWHLVMPDGRVRSGGAAAAPLLRLLPFGAGPAALADAFPRLTERVYRLVARHRGRVGRWLGTEPCAVEPGHGRS